MDKRTPTRPSRSGSRPARTPADTVRPPPSIPSGSPRPLRRLPGAVEGCVKFPTRAKVLVSWNLPVCRASISAMRVRKLPWLLTPALLLASCTSTVPEPGQSSTTRSSVGSGEELRSNPIESVFIAGPTSLVLQVDHSSCRELVPWLSEFPDRVEVAALSSDLEDEESCSSIGVGRISPLEIELEAPLGERQLVLRVPEAILDGEAGIPSLCVYELGDHWCLEALVIGGDKELPVGAPRYPPTALYSSIGPESRLL